MLIIDDNIYHDLDIDEVGGLMESVNRHNTAHIFVWTYKGFGETCLCGIEEGEEATPGMCVECADKARMLTLYGTGS